MAELLASLENYRVSPESGFLPSCPPLERLPNPYYEPWETVATSLAKFIDNGTLKKRVHTMPVLSTAFVLTEEEWRRAYVILGFVCNGYLFGGDNPPDRLPLSISQPMIEVSSYLGLPPVPTYAGQALWNFRRVGDSYLALRPEDVETLVSFTGSSEESGFFAVILSIEARGAELIPTMLEGIEAARRQDARLLMDCFQTAAGVLTDIASLLQGMYKNCNQEFFYHRLRPFLDGIRNLDSVGLPDGVFFEEKHGGQYRKYFGPSNAQSSLFAFIDITLGIKHKQEGFEGKTATHKNTYLKEMRIYMPRPHRELLNDVERVANIREFVCAHPEDMRLQDTYTNLAALAHVRQAHIQMVARYVVIMAKRPLAEKSDGQLNSDARRGEGVNGTEGTSSMSFLKSVRNSVLQAKGETASKIHAYPQR